MNFIDESKKEQGKKKSKLEVEVGEQKKNISVENESIYFALLSLLGEKEDRNINDAVFQLKIASKRGNSYASFILGLLNETGVEIEQNMTMNDQRNKDFRRASIELEFVMIMA